MSASTALSTVPCAVIITTGSSASLAQRARGAAPCRRLRHPQIGDHQVDVVLLQERERLLAVLGDVHLVAVARELRAEHLPQVRLVVDDQDLLVLGQHGCARSTRD